MTKQQRTERDAAIAQLREWLKPGDTVYTILRHVSRSGMQREIGVVLPQKPTDDGRPITFIYPNWSIGKALGLRQGKSDGLIVDGCGMDMGFHLVNSLSHALYGSGYACLGKGKCPSNYHHNAGHLDGGRAAERFDLTHADGYALRHEWL